MTTKTVTSWGFVFKNSRHEQVGAQVGFDGPEKATQKEREIARNRARAETRRTKRP